MRPQAGLAGLAELQRRATAINARQRELHDKHASLAAERTDLARGNRLRQAVDGFAARIAAVIDQLDPAQQQKLLRLLIEDVQVTGWHVQIRLRIRSTTRHQALNHTTPNHNPARHTPATPPRSCQPKTVCVPFMATVSA
jgi:hypothetical protein